MSGSGDSVKQQRCVHRGQDNFARTVRQSVSIQLSSTTILRRMLAVESFFRHRRIEHGDGTMCALPVSSSTYRSRHHWIQGCWMAFCSMGLCFERLNRLRFRRDIGGSLRSLALRTGHPRRETTSSGVHQTRERDPFEPYISTMTVPSPRRIRDSRSERERARPRPANRRRSAASRPHSRAMRTLIRNARTISTIGTQTAASTNRLGRRTASNSIQTSRESHDSRCSPSGGLMLGVRASP